MSDAEDDVLKLRWRANQTPLAILDDAVEQATGAPPRSVERLLVSYSNDVYDVVAGDGRSLIVRVHARSDPGHFDRERWALDRCREAGVPVPEILEIFEREDDGVNRSIAVQTKLPGDPLSSSRDAPEVDEHAVVHRAGTLLRAVHSVPTTGFGLIDGNGAAPVSSWRQFSGRFDAGRLTELAKEVQFDPGLVVAGTERLQEAGQPEGQPHLLHGDFDAKHVLVEGSHVTGIIDFEFARSGSRWADLAFWRYWQPDTFESLMEGYGEEVDQELLLLHSLDISLSYLDHHAPLGELVGEFRDTVEARLIQDAK